MRAPGELLHFVRGEPIAVEVGEIERALADLWKQASSNANSATGAEAAEYPADEPVSRAALWNVVIPARGRDALAATKQLVDELAPALPTRTITLCLDDGRMGGGAGNDLQATIESNVVAQPGGARTVYSEEIMMAGPPGAEAHFGALVRALQVPGVPTATFWMDPTMPASLLTRELLPMTSRLVLDTTACLRPKHLFDFERLATTAHPLPIADLAWLRLGPLRSLFAGMFDPPVGGGPLQRATRLAVTHRAGSDAAALLMLAWIGVLLDWRPPAFGADLRWRLALRLRPRQHNRHGDAHPGRRAVWQERHAGGRARGRGGAIRDPSHGPGSGGAGDAARAVEARHAGRAFRRRAVRGGAGLARPRSAVRALPDLRPPALVARARQRRQPKVERQGDEELLRACETTRTRRR